MLPAIINSKSARRTAIAAITALAMAIPSAPAFAFNQREQDVLKGIAAVLLFQGAVRATKPAKPQYVTPQVEPIYEPVHPPRVVHSIYRTPAAQAFNSYSSSERRMIQRRLIRLGYYRGGVDGAFGPGTYSAVAAYARDGGQGRALASTQGSFAVYDGLIF
jgi:hypothetical protein